MHASYSIFICLQVRFDQICLELNVAFKPNSDQFKTLSGFNEDSDMNRKNASHGLGNNGSLDGGAGENLRSGHGDGNRVPRVRVFSGKAEMESKPEVLGAKNVIVENCPYEAADKTHGIVICTEWDEFKDYDYSRIYSKMQRPAFIFDGRKILDHKKLMQMGFKVVTIGRNLHYPKGTTINS